MHLLIACAGSGRRMGAERNKLLLEVAGRPVLAWTLEAALACGDIRWIGIVGQPIDQAAIEGLVAAVNPDRPVVWIQGGDTRQESVSNGLAALPPEASSVLIHDGARCLVDPDLISRCSQAVAAGAAVIAAAPVTDTIKRVDGDGVIQDTPDRSQLWGAQTPQGFPVQQLRDAHARAVAEGWSVTDDASLFERLGWAVQVIEASPSNIKITTPFDLTIAAAVLAGR
ncbi:2-C-methyl-D-erythritol 4-phosphate cytidylyltransferase [Synechococcus sp. HJ21-Hayes]|uniref:2-C-methyl-D-erythritol 4-phosphate cytidylyltransferase n=1 Tax=unclassified Synechococcus TaxID=2626047 RepID=UPI0020CCF06E|nr:MULTISPECIES: 2-C-methyl-D-erythritol 4-phosphate cytidylyltransferase [unclassified Synechococcus]MCP9831822.1 2-C-methyl-D-erythritol 4-phosphate cytidylyltransferase [Synechococcus sp. JJ3a-Johnson]MCP9853743.1 2-C-methyl-D-erythritol 4-phosphate cytidylyltransferase [Synechococcus sp. HJ21-Hayes]